MLRAAVDDAASNVAVSASAVMASSLPGQCRDRVTSLRLLVSTVRRRQHKGADQLSSPICEKLGARSANTIGAR